MHIETLKTFRDLVDTGSFSKAARLNFISQSAVSQQLKALETRYDCRLLERSGRGVVALTDAGRIFYAECKELLERFRALEARLGERATVIAGTVRMATVYSIGLHELPSYVTRFMRAYPHVPVHVEYRRTDKVCDGCLDDTLDFGIVAFPIRRANVAVIPWHEEKLVLVCPPAHRLARRRRVRVADLRGEDFIAFDRDIPTRKTVDRILADHGVTVNLTRTFDNIETIKRAVEVGSGIAILPETTVGTEVKSGLLARADFSEGPFTRSVGVIHRRGRVLSAAAREFVRMLKSG
jgi:DNA-binding transcriptional LysR family regulator